MKAFQAGIPVLCFGLSQSTAMAGEPPTIAPLPADSSNGDWCEWLSNKPGTLFKNPENPWFQELVFFGRFQWQAAYLAGEDTNGYEFSDGYTEVRRFRLGLSTKFLNYFSLKANANLVDDTSNQAAVWPGGQKLGWGYEDFDEALLSFDVKKAFGIEGVDQLSVSYGRHKFELSNEAWESSRSLLTVERSAISNKVYGSYRPTGVSVNVVKGDWDLVTALYSTDAMSPAGGNNRFIGGWNDGLAYYASVGYQATDELGFRFDYVCNDADLTSGKDSLFAYRWATSISAVYDKGKWGMITDLIYGDNGDLANGVARANRQGDFWGAVVMPYYWVADQKLQAVVRYQYQGSQNVQGIRINSRYGRADHGPVVNANAFAAGRGNEHHSLYGGFNYYLCGNNLKLQAGLEYDWLNIAGGGVHGAASSLTTWFGFRSYF